MHDMLPLLNLGQSDFPAIQRDKLTTLQVNLGYLCNQQCQHCHVDAGPKRTEIMTRETVDQVLQCLTDNQLQVLDLTGGAPEMNPHFTYLVKAARNAGVHVIDRCNLSVLLEPGQENLASFLAENEVEIVASLPCYIEENVDGQRGKGVYQKSIDGLKRLNALGYGTSDKLKLNLMYNPTGPYLPPSQDALAIDYRKELGERFGLVFSDLFTLVNMPIKRFGSMLVSKNQYNDYMELLRTSYSACNLNNVMCRHLVSVDWQGYLYDCDFNQMMKLPVGGEKRHISTLLGDNLKGNSIVVADHCYGCTAGQGSSCGGALAD